MPVKSNNSSSSSSSSSMTSNRPLFPLLLHDMLEDVERRGLESIISWCPDGKSFRVHKKNDSVDKVLSIYFKQSKYKSFVRQLNLWNFSCITAAGPNKGAYQNDMFIRGRKDLCSHMKRRKSLISSSSSSTMKSSSVAIATTRPTPPPPAFPPPLTTTSKRTSNLSGKVSPNIASFHAISVDPLIFLERQHQLDSTAPLTSCTGSLQQSSTDVITSVSQPQQDQQYVVFSGIENNEYHYETLNDDDSDVGFPTNFDDQDLDGNWINELKECLALDGRPQENTYHVEFVNSPPPPPPTRLVQPTFPIFGRTARPLCQPRLWSQTF